MRRVFNFRCLKTKRTQKTILLTDYRIYIIDKLCWLQTRATATRPTRISARKTAIDRNPTTSRPCSAAGPEGKAAAARTRTIFFPRSRNVIRSPHSGRTHSSRRYHVLRSRWWSAVFPFSLRHFARPVENNRDHERVRAHSAGDQVRQRRAGRVSKTPRETPTFAYTFLNYYSPVPQHRGHRHRAPIGRAQEPHADGRSRRRGHRSPKIHGRHRAFHDQGERRVGFLSRSVRRRPQTGHVLCHPIGHVQLVIHRHVRVSSVVAFTGRSFVHCAVCSSREDNKPPGLLVKLGIAMVSGVTGAAVGTPAEVALIRMTSDAQLPLAERRGYTSVFNALARIAREEGIATWWRGCIATMGRAAVVNMAQLASYSQAKEIYLKSGKSCSVVF